MGDDAVEIEGYDGIDDTPSYSPSPGRRNMPSPGRHGGKKNLSVPAQHHGKRGRSLGRSFSLNVDPRQIAGSISGMLVLSVVGVAAVAGILYYTFASGSYPSSFPQFYGALAAAMVFVLLMAYVTVRLLGSGE